MNMKNITAAIALVASATIVGCAQLDTGTLAKTGATAGVAASSTGKGGKKAGAAVAAGAAGAGAATAIAASSTGAKPSNGNAPAQTQGASAQPASTQANATQRQQRLREHPAAKTAETKPKPQPAFTVEQYRTTFAKRTPEQIANDIIAVSKMSDNERKASRHNVDNMCAALFWANGFEVLQSLKKDSDVYFDARKQIQPAIYASIDGIKDQAELRDAISKLPIKLKGWYEKYGYEYDSFSVNGNFLKPIAYYSRAIELITDPSVADYMLSRNLYLGYEIRALVPKLSKMKKDELYAAAMKRASERKDRVVMEGFYIGMPFLDFLIVRSHNGLDKPLKDGSGKMCRAWLGEDKNGLDDFENERKLASDAEVVRLWFANKAWAKFMDCEDKDALRQFIHQYVKGKSGKAGKFDYLTDIKHEIVEMLDNALAEVYTNTRLETKVAFSPKTGEITFLEF